MDWIKNVVAGATQCYFAQPTVRQDQEGGGTWIGGGSKDCIPARWEARDLHISISSPSLLPF